MDKILTYLKEKFKDNPVIVAACEIAEKNPMLQEELLLNMIKYIIHELEVLKTELEKHLEEEDD